MLRFMGSQRVGTTEGLNWTELKQLETIDLIDDSKRLVNRFSAFFNMNSLMVLPTLNRELDCEEG